MTIDRISTPPVGGSRQEPDLGNLMPKERERLTGLTGLERILPRKPRRAVLKGEGGLRRGVFRLGKKFYAVCKSTSRAAAGWLSGRKAAGDKPDFSSGAARRHVLFSKAELQAWKLQGKEARQEGIKEMLAGLQADRTPLRKFAAQGILLSVVAKEADGSPSGKVDAREFQLYQKQARTALPLPLLLEDLMSILQQDARASGSLEGSRLNAVLVAMEATRPEGKDQRRNEERVVHLAALEAWRSGYARNEIAEPLSDSRLRQLAELRVDLDQFRFGASV